MTNDKNQKCGTLTMSFDIIKSLYIGQVMVYSLGRKNILCWRMKGKYDGFNTLALSLRLMHFCHQRWLENLGWSYGFAYPVMDCFLNRQCVQVGGDMGKPMAD